jgi:hypothetical protein
VIYLLLQLSFRFSIRSLRRWDSPELFAIPEDGARDCSFEVNSAI